MAMPRSPCNSAIYEGSQDGRWMRKSAASIVLCFPTLDSVKDGAPGSNTISRTDSALAGSQLLRSFGGTHDSLDQRDAQAAFFQLKNAVDSATGGGGDFVFEQGRVVAGLEHHLACAEDGLRGQLCRRVPGESNLYTGFGK